MFVKLVAMLQEIMYNITPTIYYLVEYTIVTVSSLYKTNLVTFIQDRLGRNPCQENKNANYFKAGSTVRCFTCLILDYYY